MTTGISVCSRISSACETVTSLRRPEPTWAPANRASHLVRSITRATAVPGGAPGPPHQQWVDDAREHRQLAIRVAMFEDGPHREPGIADALLRPPQQRAGVGRAPAQAVCLLHVRDDQFGLEPQAEMQ